MFTVLIFFLVLSILVIIHELGHYFAAKLQGIRVDEFGFGIPPRIAGIKIGETLYSLNALPFGGFVRVYGEDEDTMGDKLTDLLKKRSFAHKKPWQKAIVLVAGVVLNFVLGWAIVTYLFTQGVPTPTDQVHVEEVSAESPASEAGLRTGDILAKVTTPSETITVDEPTDISAAAQKYAGDEINLIVVRGSETLTVSITPRENPPKGQGALGVAISNYEIKKYSLVEAPIKGLIESARFTAIIGRELGVSLFKFVTFQKQDAEISGPVGIAQLTSEAAREGTNALLQLIGILSLNLAVLNILPFPALDGGRLMFVLYEWATGRKVKPQLEHRLNFAGFAILIGLLVLVTVNDIIKLIQ